jgi:hypothetical protein
MQPTVPSVIVRIFSGKKFYKNKKIFPSPTNMTASTSNNSTGPNSSPLLFFLPDYVQETTTIAYEDSRVVSCVAAVRQKVITMEPTDALFLREDNTAIFYSVDVVFKRSMEMTKMPGYDPLSSLEGSDELWGTSTTKTNIKTWMVQLNEDIVLLILRTY